MVAGQDRLREFAKAGEVKAQHRDAGLSQPLGDIARGADILAAIKQCANRAKALGAARGMLSTAASFSPVVLEKSKRSLRIGVSFVRRRTESCPLYAMLVAGDCDLLEISHHELSMPGEIRDDANTYACI